MKAISQTLLTNQPTLKRNPKMKVELLSQKFIKPSTPTPPSLQTYQISFTDELSPTINVPLILYYQPTAKNGTTHANVLQSMCYHLEKSLELTLTNFYPLAGRYLKDVRSVDCSDQGVEFVLAKTNIQLLDILDQGVKAETLNNFIPREIGAADEITDPLLSIQVTMFKCGGLVLGFCFSHRVIDMGAFSTFIDSWTFASKEYSNKLENPPVFNGSVFFPPRNLPKLDLRVPRIAKGDETETKMFLFNDKAISALRAKACVSDPNQKKPSKVQLVVALLYKAMIGVENAKNGRSKSSFLTFPANLRDKVDPPLPKESFGNFWGVATARVEKDDDLDFKGYVDLIRTSVKEKIMDCKKILSEGEEGYGVVINRFLEANKCISDSEVNFYLYTCWSKFSFYEADFGWGKPVWATTAKLPVQHLVILFDDRNGDGIEAWVHLDEKEMVAFEQDSDIRDFAIFY